MRIGMLLVAASMVLAAAAAPARADEKSHRAAAAELLEVANMQKAMASGIDRAISLQLKVNPRLEPVKEVLRKFFEKHISYDAIKDEMIDVYVAEFTEDELKEISAFYRTPAGKKAIEKIPTLMQKGGEIGTKHVQEHAGELKEMIEAELRKVNPR